MVGDSEVSLCVPSHVVPAGAVAALLDGGVGVAHQVDVELLAVGGLHARLGEVEVGATPRHPLPAGLAPAIPLLQTWGGLRGCFEAGLVTSIAFAESPLAVGVGGTAAEALVVGVVVVVVAVAVAIAPHPHVAHLVPHHVVLVVPARGSGCRRA